MKTPYSYVGLALLAILALGDAPPARAGGPDEAARAAAASSPRLPLRAHGTLPPLYNCTAKWAQDRDGVFWARLIKLHTDRPNVAWPWRGVYRTQNEATRAAYAADSRDAGCHAPG